MRNGNHNSIRQFPAERGPVVESYFRQLAQLLPRLPFDAMERIADAFLDAALDGRNIFVFGNGGSAASASHMMCDMNKGLAEQAGVRASSSWRLLTMFLC